MKSVTSEICGLCGLAAIGYGIWLIFGPWVWVYGGVVGMMLSVAAEMRRRKARVRQ